MPLRLESSPVPSQGIKQLSLEMCISLFLRGWVAGRQAWLLVVLLLLFGLLLLLYFS